MDKRYYLDEAATTNVNTTAEAAASGFFKSYYGNPSSIHAEGRRARKAIDTTKTLIAEQLNCAIDEIIFTSGGT